MSTVIVPTPPGSRWVRQAAPGAAGRTEWPEPEWLRAVSSIAPLPQQGQDEIERPFGRIRRRIVLSHQRLMAFRGHADVDVGRTARVRRRVVGFKPAGPRGGK